MNRKSFIVLAVIAGILAVLDSRLVRRSYGARFLESLPPARLVHDLAEVERFMA